MGVRRRGRELALQMLYQRELAGTDVEQIFHDFEELKQAPPMAGRFAVELVRGVVERLKVLVEERRSLEKQLADAKKQIALGGGGAAGPAPSAVTKVGDTNFFRLSVSGVDMKDLKAMADEGRAKVGSGVVAIANASPDGKLGIVVAVTPDLTGRYNAVDLVRAASEKSGGKGGGGRPDMAQAGGPDGTKANDALAAVEAMIGG